MWAIWVLGIGYWGQHGKKADARRQAAAVVGHSSFVGYKPFTYCVRASFVVYYKTNVLLGAIIGDSIAIKRSRVCTKGIEMTNREIAAILFIITTILSEHRASPYRIRAYRNAAR